MARTIGCDDGDLLGVRTIGTQVRRQWPTTQARRIGNAKNTLYIKYALKKKNVLRSGSYCACDRRHCCELLKSPSLSEPFVRTHMHSVFVTLFSSFARFFFFSLALLGTSIMSPRLDPWGVSQRATVNLSINRSTRLKRANVYCTWIPRHTTYVHCEHERPKLITEG